MAGGKLRKLSELCSWGALGPHQQYNVSVQASQDVQCLAQTG